MRGVVIFTIRRAPTFVKGRVGKRNACGASIATALRGRTHLVPPQTSSSATMAVIPKLRSASDRDSIPRKDQILAMASTLPNAETLRG